MCKIVTFTNLSKVKNIEKLITVVAEHLLFYEKDGFGYAIESDKGVFGERIIDSENFEYGHNKDILNVSWLTTNRNKFGIRGSVLVSGVFHGRTSTNQINLSNTHPIKKGDTYLIHNGVVSNNGPTYIQETSNDTEHLLHYLNQKNGIQEIEKFISGYYAVCALKDKELIIFKDSIAPLFAAYIKEIDSFIFATTEILITQILKEMEYEHSNISAMNNDTFLKFKDGILTENFKIKPFGYSKRETKYAEKSLGKNINEFSYRDSHDSYNSYDKWDQYDSEHRYNKNKKTNKNLSENDLSQFTESEQQFLDEVNYASDNTYYFKSYKGEEISYDEFIVLLDSEKLYCTVVRSDGTIVDPNDYYTDKLYEGNIAI